MITRCALLLVLVLTTHTGSAHAASPSPAHGAGALRPPSPSVGILAPHIDAASLPPRADLSAYDPPVGNQGVINSCASWATGYTLRGWYAERDGTYPAGGFAPMYLYTQVEQPPGSNSGTQVSDNLDILLHQGIAPQSQYPYGTDDYVDLPTTAARAAAAPYTITTYREMFWPASGDVQAQAEQDLATGTPFVLILPIDAAFHGLGPWSYRYADATDSSAVWSGTWHAVMADGYDSYGVWIENSWGTAWGLKGRAELSWSFLKAYGYGYDVSFHAPTPTDTPTPTSTSTPSPTPTATFSPSATPTATLAPSVTAMPTASPTTTPSPTATAQPTGTPTPLSASLVPPPPVGVPTKTPTPSPTSTPTASATGTATSTDTPTATALPTPADTQTVRPPVPVTRAVTPVHRVRALRMMRRRAHHATKKGRHHRHRW